MDLKMDLLAEILRSRRHKSGWGIGSIKVQLEIEIIEQRIVHAKSGPDGGFAIAERVPRQAHAGTKQLGRVILRERRRADVRGAILRVAEGCAAGIRDVVGSPPILFVPTVREFVPNSGSQRQIGAQLDDVLNIPGA